MVQSLGRGAVVLVCRGCAAPLLLPLNIIELGVMDVRWFVVLRSVGVEFEPVLEGEGKNIQQRYTRV